MCTLAGAAGAGAQARAAVAEVLEQLATWPMRDPGPRLGAPEARRDNAWLTRADVQALADQALRREVPGEVRCGSWPGSLRSPSLVKGPSSSAEAEIIMAKQQLLVVQAPTNKKRTVAGALIVIVLLAFIIEDPAGAAALATGIGEVIGGAIEGAVTFFGSLN